MEKRRCLSCGNMQDVMTVDDALTIFFKCEKCNTTTFYEDIIDEMLLTPTKIIDTT